MSLSQHLSQAVRAKLAQACLDGYRAKVGNYGRGHMAEDLGVKPYTITEWVKYQKSVSDDNLGKLVALSLRVAPGETRRILLGDLESHRRLVEEL